MLERSTEKSCAIKGPTQVVINALTSVVTLMGENQDVLAVQPVTPYVPMAPQPMFDPMTGQYGMYGAYGASSYGGYNQYGQAANNPYGQYGQVNSGPQQQFVIRVPDSLIGGIIGKRGRTITDIRQRSGANIKISDSDPNTMERTVTIRGTEQANQIALALVYEKMNPAGQTSLAAGMGLAPTPTM